MLRRERLGDRPWSLLSQSSGEFVAMTYLSLAPGSLERVHVTGGYLQLTARGSEQCRYDSENTFRFNANIAP